jgi:hypothetical protein
MQSESIYHFSTVEEAITRGFHSHNGEAVIQGVETMLKEIGFPELRGSSMDLLVALEPQQMVEMIRYVGFQLASEGYIYRSPRNYV